MKLVWKILLELVVLMFLFAWYPDAARSIGDQLGMSRQFFGPKRKAPP